MNDKKHWILGLSCLLIFASWPITTDAKDSTNNGKYDSKDEVIYGNLYGDGDIKELYVVNSFDISNPGKIIDYGDYSTVRNLSNLSEISQSKNKISFDAEDEGEFYYQGELENKPLPWDISITYLLDDKEIDPSELAGKSGHLDIQISTAKNAKVDPVFFEYYLLQISLTMDPLKFKNIQAPEATEANEGKNKNFNFSVMPDQEEDLIISADVTDMEMDPIDISAVPANIAMEDPDIGDMTSDMKKLADGIKEINEGVSELTDGISEWSDGASELKSGSTEFKNGIQELDNSSDELISGSEQILNAMREVSNAMEDAPDPEQFDDLDDLQSLPDGMREAAKEIREYADGMDDVNDTLNQIPKEELDEEQFDKALEALEENDVDQEIIDSIKQFQEVYEESEEWKDIDLEIPDDATSVMNEMATELEGLANEIEDNLNNLDQLEELEKLKDGLTSMSSEYESFHNGLVEYTSGVHEIATSYNEIDTGITELTDGANSLEDGASELQEGTQELQDETENLPNDMESELDEMMEEFDFSDFEPTSYVSDKNDKVDVVQFVLQTEKIKITEPEKEDQQEEEKSIWDRFLDLFK